MSSDVVCLSLTALSVLELLTMTYCDEAGDYAMPNVLSPGDLVFRLDLSDINWTIIITSLSLCWANITFVSNVGFSCLVKVSKTL